MELNWSTHSLIDFFDGFCPEGWEDFFLRDDIQCVLNNLSEIITEDNVEPALQRLFITFNHITPENIKVIIFKEHPEVGENGVPYCSTKYLNNIKTEVERDGFAVVKGKSFASWVKQGVFLCYISWTFSDNPIHTKLWCQFTKLLLKFIEERHEEKMVIMSWGPEYKKYENIFNIENRLFMPMTIPHGSGYMDNFRAKFIFQDANNYLEKNGIAKINWGF